jgi:serine/alanine adding enzyme
MKAKLDILALDERGHDWDAALAQLAPRQRDVFWLSGWSLLAQRRGEGRALGALFRDDQGAVLYPFLLRDLDQVPYLGPDFAGLHDITTPAGFGGPLSPHGTSEETVAAFRAAFEQWCRDQRVVSEFIRFHPLLETSLLMQRHLEIEEAGQIVWLRLDQGGCRIIDTFSATARKNVRTARDAGLTCHVETSAAAYERLGELYLDNAVRRRALPAFRFQPAHFLELRELLGSHQTLFGVRSGDELVAGAILLRSPDFVHFYLAGADRGHAHLRPMNVLFFEATQWASGLGATALSLGGGYRGEDEWFRFKAGFSPYRAPRPVGRAVYLFEEYARAEERRLQQGQIIDCDYFPLYRSPLPDEGLLGAASGA